MQITFSNIAKRLLGVTCYGILVGVTGLTASNTITTIGGAIITTVGVGGLAVTGAVYLGNTIYSNYLANKMVRETNYEGLLDHMLLAEERFHEVNFAATVQTVTVNSASVTTAPSTFIGGEAVNPALQAIAAATSSTWTKVSSLLPNFTRPVQPPLDDAYDLLGDNDLSLEIAPNLTEATMHELHMLPAGNTNPKAHDLECDSGVESAEEDNNDQHRKLIAYSH